MVLTYRSMPEFVRMGCTATIGAAVGLLTYEVIYFVMPAWYRATTSWALAFLVGVARQHGLHRWLTFPDDACPYWSSLYRAYGMYSGTFVLGATLNWVLVEQLKMHYRQAWGCCLITTVGVSFIFLRRFVFRRWEQ